MPSLKSYTDTLASHLGVTSAALYERQRALVRAGILPVESGRGPGSGVRATPRNVAYLLLAVLGVEDLQDVGRRVFELARAVLIQRDGVRKLLIDSLEEVLDNPTVAAGTSLLVSRTSNSAEMIHFVKTKHHGDKIKSHPLFRGREEVTEAAIEIDATIRVGILEKIAAALRDPDT